MNIHTNMGPSSILNSYIYMYIHVCICFNINNTTFIVVESFVPKKKSYDFANIDRLFHGGGDVL